MINGMLNVRKEQGFTSHDVVAKLRGILKQKKIGHTGTLDPDATGVLPVCLGRATRASEMMTGGDKRYDATLLFGRSTDTQDVSGETIREIPESEVLRLLKEAGDGDAEAAVRAAMQHFLSVREQIPPMYSAIKQGGRHLYELARAGKVVERPARPVRFYEIRIEEIDLPRVRFSVRCSGGTYIRTLCHDIGERLSVGACMEALTRTEAGPFSIEDAHSISEIEEQYKKGRIEEWITPVDALFSEYGALRLLPGGDRFAHNGNPLIKENFQSFDDALLGSSPDARVRVYDSKGRFVGLYRRGSDGEKIVPDKIFLDLSEGVQ